MQYNNGKKSVCIMQMDEVYLDMQEAYLCGLKQNLCQNLKK